MNSHPSITIRVLLLSLIMPLVAPAAVVIGTFSDDFNRANGSLGANYLTRAGNAFQINNNVVTQTYNGADGLTTLEATNLPSLSDYSSGYSFSAKLDIFVGGSGGTPGTYGNTTGGVGLLLNYQDNNNYTSIRFRGVGANVIQAAGRASGTAYAVQLAILPQASMPTYNGWYTLSIASTSAGIYDYTWTLASTPETIISNGTFDLAANGKAVLSGGYTGFAATAGNGYTSNIDNFSVTIVPEPSSAALALAGFGVLAFAIRRRHYSRRVALSSDRVS